MTERKLSRYLVGRIIYVLCLLAILLVVGSITSANGEQNNTRTLSRSYPIDSIQVQINLHKDGGASVTETWLFDYDEEKLRAASPFGQYLLNVFDYGTAELENLHILDNGNELRQVDDSTEEISPGSFKLHEKNEGASKKDYYLELHPFNDGQKELVLSYDLKNYISLLEDDKAALEYDYSDGLWGWAAQSVSVCISMDGRDLSKESFYGVADGFRGYAGFDGPNYRTKTFNKLERNANMVIHLALSPGLFDNLNTRYDGRYKSNFSLDRSIKSLEKTPIDFSFYQACVSASIAAAFLAIVLLLVVALHLRRVYATNHGDDSITSESSRKHWLSYMWTSLILSIALFGLAILTSNLMPVVWWFPFVATVFPVLLFNSALMIDGLTTLRRVRKVENRTSVDA